MSKLSSALGLIQLVGSAEVSLLAHALFEEALKDEGRRDQPQLAAFVFAARKDLGHPIPRFLQKEVDRQVLPAGEGDAG